MNLYEPISMLKILIFPRKNFTEIFLCDFNASSMYLVTESFLLWGKWATVELLGAWEVEFDTDWFLRFDWRVVWGGGNNAGTFPFLGAWIDVEEEDEEVGSTAGDAGGIKLALASLMPRFFSNSAINSLSKCCSPFLAELVIICWGSAFWGCKIFGPGYDWVMMDDEDVEVIWGILFGGGLNPLTELQCGWCIRGTTLFWFCWWNICGGWTCCCSCKGLEGHVIMGRFGIGILGCWFGIPGLADQFWICWFDADAIGGIAFCIVAVLVGSGKAEAEVCFWKVW